MTAKLIFHNLNLLVEAQAVLKFFFVLFIMTFLLLS